MDNFLGTLVFLLPGVMAYFWLQSFGINPVTKHTTAEFTAISALLWLPVSIVTLFIYNAGIRLCVYISNNNPQSVWTIGDLKQVSVSFGFLAVFLVLSSVVSFLVSVLWSKWGHQCHLGIINKIRVWQGVAPFSKKPSVWDEVFLNNDAQVVEIGRIDKPECDRLIGSIEKVSRPLEPERNICLNEVEFFTKLVNDNNIPIINTFYDTKSGTYIKIFDPVAIKEAQD